MSYEGYTQFLCSSGHYWCEDALAQMYGMVDAPQCPVCNKDPVWANEVDETNGSFDAAGERIDHYVELALAEANACCCPSCGVVHHSAPPTYVIPEHGNPGRRIVTPTCHSREAPRGEGEQDQ